MQNRHKMSRLLPSAC